MRIALGSDHRGAQIARKIAADVLLREHYVGPIGVRRAEGELLGAYIIVGATTSDSFDDEGREENSEETKIYPIEYRGADRPVVEVVESNEKPTDKKSSDENAPVKCVDYPDVAAAVAQAVSKGSAEKGILICGTGVGMGIAANKFRGVRAAVCYNEVAAELSRRHNDANVLCLSGEFLGVQAIESLVRVWLETPYDGGRHARRVEKIAKIEEETGL